MALIESKPNEIVQKDEKHDKSEAEYTYRVYPDINKKVDYNSRTIELEIALPGVAKENITLKALPDFFHIEGIRKNVIYTANYAWGIEIVPEKTSAKYENGLLRIHAVIRNPMDDAKAIVL